jgi:RNA polymerase sigma factor (sigma-70 family)
LLLPYLRAIAKRYLRNDTFWKDVLQESFVKIFKHISQYNYNKGTIQSWSAKIVINTCLNYNSRISQNSFEELSLSDYQLAASTSVSQSLSDEELLIILKQMPESYFEVFNLYVIDGFDHQEIAQILGIDAALSRQRLTRAKNWLRNLFDRRPSLALDLQLSHFFLN